MCHVVIGRLKVRGSVFIKDSNAFVKAVASHGLLYAVKRYVVKYGLRAFLEPFHGAEVTSCIDLQKTRYGIYADASCKGITLPYLHTVMEDYGVVGACKMDASVISVSCSILKGTFDKLSVCLYLTEVLTRGHAGLLACQAFAFHCS